MSLNNLWLNSTDNVEHQALLDMMFPELRTERLALKQIHASDQQKIFEGLSDPMVIRYYGVSYSTYEATQEQMAWYENLWTTGTGAWWKICDLETNEFMGACGLNNLQRIHKKAEMGFWLLPQFWGKGIIPKAIEQVLNYAFGKFDLHRIEAFVEVGNESSMKALLKGGFKHEGTMEDVERKNGKFISLHVFAKLSDR